MPKTNRSRSATELEQIKERLTNAIADLPTPGERYDATLAQMAFYYQEKALKTQAKQLDKFVQPKDTLLEKHMRLIQAYAPPGQPRLIQQCSPATIPAPMEQAQAKAYKLGELVAIGIAAASLGMALLIWHPPRLELPTFNKNKPTKPVVRKGVATLVPQKGQVVGSWIVSSGWGPRPRPLPRASTFHAGIDLVARKGATHGRALYAIGQKGSKVRVKCWQDSKGGGLVVSSIPTSESEKFDYLHASWCVGNLTVLAGTVIGKVGNSGLPGMAAHLHLTQRNKYTNKKEPPFFTYAERALHGGILQ